MCAKHISVCSLETHHLPHFLGYSLRFHMIGEEKHPLPSAPPQPPLSLASSAKSNSRNPSNHFHKVSPKPEIMSRLISELSIPAAPPFPGCDRHSWTVFISIITAFAALFRSALHTCPGGDPGRFHTRRRIPRLTNAWLSAKDVVEGSKPEPNHSRCKTRQRRVGFGLSCLLPNKLSLCKHTP